MRIDAGSIKSISSGTVASARLPEATSSALGAVKKNRVLYKQDTSNAVSTSTTGLLSATNIPQGVYKVTVGARYIKLDDGSASDAYIQPQLNNDDIILYFAGGTNGRNWQIGNLGASDIAVEQGTYLWGQSDTRILEFPNATNSFDLNLYVAGADSLVVGAYYILEKLENYEEITTEWD